MVTRHRNKAIETPKQHIEGNICKPPSALISEEVEEARNAEILLELDHLGMIQVNGGLVRAIGRRSKGDPVEVVVQ